jgi:dTDP-4-amino-4,6-dideoxygalactose transaminase
MNEQSTVTRRYFYPSLNTLPYVEHSEMAISDSISQRILCLPLYVGLEKLQMEQICKIIYDKLRC